MTPEQYCYQKVAKPGSMIYYSVRGLSLLERQAIVAIQAFYREMDDIILRSSDLNVAHTQLNWWRDQIVKMHDNKTLDHPIAIALKKSVDHFHLNSFAFMDVINGLEQELTSCVFATFADLVIHIMRTVGKRELIIMDILLQGDETVSTETIYQFAITLALVHYLQHLRQYVKRGVMYFAEDELQQFKVTLNDFQQYQITPAIVELLQHQTERIKRNYLRAKASLMPSMYSRLEHLITRCEMSCAILLAIEKSQFKVLENFIDITPLHYWWIAWKSNWNACVS